MSVKRRASSFKIALASRHAHKYGSHATFYISNHDKSMCNCNVKGKYFLRSTLGTVLPNLTCFAHASVPRPWSAIRSLASGANNCLNCIIFFGVLHTKAVRYLSGCVERPEIFCAAVRLTSTSSTKLKLLTDIHEIVVVVDSAIFSCNVSSAVAIYFALNNNK